MHGLDGEFSVGSCENDADLRSVVGGALGGQGFEVRATATGHNAVKRLSEDPPDVLVLARRLRTPGVRSGFCGVAHGHAGELQMVGRIAWVEQPRAERSASSWRACASADTAGRALGVLPASRDVLRPPRRRAGTVPPA